MQTREVKSTLFLLGSFMVSYNVEVALHEFGHVLALWVSGGTVSRVILHPFSWSYTYYGSVPAPLFTTWGGVVFATVVGLLLVRLIWRSTSPSALPALLIGVIALVQSGVYLTVDYLANGGGDGTELVSLGTPPWLVVAVGAIMACIGLIAAAKNVWMFGFRAEDGIGVRIAILLAGIGPYLLAMLVYHCWTNWSEIVLWTIYVAVGFTFMTLIAIGSRSIQRRWQTTAAVSPTLRWSTVLTMLAIGLGIVMTELIWFSQG